MGLGRLNPGCQCMCEVLPQPTDSCQLAGQFWGATKITLTCQSLGGSPVIDCGDSPVLCSDALRPNPATVTAQIPRYFDEGFQCGIGVSSFGNYKVGFSNDFLYECVGMWPIWTSGSCLLGLANFYRVGSVNQWFYPYFANGYVELGYSQPLNVGYLTARITVAAVVFSGAGIAYGSGACPDSPSLLPTPPGGTNWQFSSNGLVQTGTEINGPPVRTSRYVWRPATNYSLPGSLGTSPFWCSDGHNYQTILSESTYSIATSDPIYGDMRSFDLWTPLPAIDELGLTLDASVSIETQV